MLVAPLLMWGCGGDGRPSLVPVQGVVTLDGEPVDGAQLGFMPLNEGDYKRSSRAQSDATGTFTIGTYAKDDGLPPGKYKVTITKQEQVGKLPDDYNSEDPTASSKPLKVKWIVPKMYSIPDETDVTVEITSDGMEPSSIDLTSDGGPQVEALGGGGGNIP